MAITTALCNAAKRDFLNGIHQAAHVYKFALIKAGHAGTFGAANTSYTQIGVDEASGTGYAAGGVALAGYAAGLNGTTGTLDWTNVSIPSASISADGGMIYNDTAAGKPAIAVFAFSGAPITSTNAEFFVELPTGGVGAVVNFA